MKKLMLIALPLIALAVAIPVGVSRARVRQQEPEQPGSKTVLTRIVETPLGAPRPPRAPLFLGENGLGAARFDSLSAEVAGNVVFVKGIAEIADRVRDNQYVWLLRAYQDKKLVWEHHYTDHVFAMEQERASPEFRDQIELPPGDYRLKLTLYSVPKNFDFAKLAPGEEMKTWATLFTSGVQRVTIAPQ